MARLAGCGNLGRGGSSGRGPGRVSPRGGARGALGGAGAAGRERGGGRGAGAAAAGAAAGHGEGGRELVLLIVVRMLLGRCGRGRRDLLQGRVAAGAAVDVEHHPRRRGGRAACGAEGPSPGAKGHPARGTGEGLLAGGLEGRGGGRGLGAAELGLLRGGVFGLEARAGGVGGRESPVGGRGRKDLVSGVCPGEP